MADDDELLGTVGSLFLGEVIEGASIPYHTSPDLACRQEK